MFVFCTHDAGPANYLSAILSGLNSNEYLCMHSDISKEVFQKFDISSIPFDLGVLASSDVQLVVTGTCLGQDMDKDLIRWAKEHGIFCISIIEHWSHYWQRFVINDRLELPDLVFVNDELAFKGCVEAGIPEDQLKIVGNPFLERLESKPNTQSTFDEFVFISEDLIDFNGVEDDCYLGYNEFEILDEISKNLLPEKRLYIKMHPAEQMGKYDHYLKRENISILDNPDKSMLGEKGCLIGMSSFLLIELAIMGHQVYSYRPNARGPFIGNQLNLVKELSRDELSKLLKTGKTIPYNRKGVNFKGSLANIIDFITDLNEDTSNDTSTNRV